MSPGALGGVKGAGDRGHCPWWEASPKQSCGQAAKWKRDTKMEMEPFCLTCVSLSSGSTRCAASAAGQTDLVAEIVAGHQEGAQVTLALVAALAAARLVTLPCEKGLWEGPAVREDFCLVGC